MTSTTLRGQTEAAGDFDIEWANNPGEYEWQKIKLLLSFKREVKKKFKSINPTCVLAYDSIALYSIKPLLLKASTNTFFWYHNHDVPEKEKISRFSLGYLAMKNEHTLISRCNLFSIPAEERLEYYSNLTRRIQTFCIPNFPSVKTFGNTHSVNSTAGIHLSFNGHVSSTHGLEMIVSLLSETVHGKHLFLDRRLIESSEGVELVFNPPEQPRENLIPKDRPWEQGQPGSGGGPWSPGTTCSTA